MDVVNNHQGTITFYIVNKFDRMFLVLAMIVLNLNALKWNIIAQRLDFFQGMFQENFNPLFQ